uniref:Uncharacterized protein n=1 Tax=Oryza nivara TaxID=4536 RepID=A0A0E0FZ17_ORYNI
MQIYSVKTTSWTCRARAGWRRERKSTFSLSCCVFRDGSIETTHTTEQLYGLYESLSKIHMQWRKRNQIYEKSLEAKALSKRQTSKGNFITFKW